MRVLVVEDEAKVARALREGLEREKYEVVVAPSGEEGFFLVNAEEFDLVLLDLMLPGRDGLQVLSTLRKSGLQTPVLILTARDAIEDRVEGLIHFPAKPVDVHVHDVIEWGCTSRLFPDVARQHLPRNDLLFVPKQVFKKLKLSGRQV